MFFVDINNENIFPVIQLNNDEEKTTAEIYSFGALLNAFTISDSINIIDGFASPQDAQQNITNGFKSAKLSPFVCRIIKGKYVFNNAEYKIDKFFLGKEAIHGLLYDANFVITDFGTSDNAAFVTLQYNYSKKEEGFPFNYTCTVTYSLEKNNSLSVETVIKNNSGSKMPVCDGWHPYFKLDVDIDDLLFQINSEKMLEFNERLIPTGNILPFKKFQEPEFFGKTGLDNCFFLNENNKPACFLKNNKSGLQVSIWPDKSYSYLQVYTPDHRKSIAIENLSAAPDAFNNKIGLKVLKSGESCSFKTSYTATVKL